MTQSPTFNLFKSPGLTRPLLLLAGPVLIEHVLHMLVGLTDTYLANHLPADKAAATAAVGTVTYFLWFIGLIAGAIGSGSTALIARAIGAKHRGLANAVTGQSVSLAILLGLAIGGTVAFAAPWIVWFSQLEGPAYGYALLYLRMLALSLPFSTLMFVGGSCLRGGGDTVTPAIAMVTVDLVNLFLSFALCRGWFGLPVLGFVGIALGTIIAYVIGGVILFVALWLGRSPVKLKLHRLRPHWHTLRRVLRIGLPSGAENLIGWSANFGVVMVINGADRSSAMAAAHINAIRIESISFMTGYAFAVAAAAMVGQNLGANRPDRATRAAYLAYAIGGGAMVFMGLLFIFFNRWFASWLSDDPHIADLTAQCLFITGTIQAGFAASIIFGGALRGAGDTLSVMMLNLASVVGVRLTGVLIVGLWLNLGLVAIWYVLAGELFLRGCLVYGRFLNGGWRQLRV